MFKRASSLKTRVASSFGVGAMALTLVVGGVQIGVAEDTAAQAQKESVTSVSSENVELAATSRSNWPYVMEGHTAYSWNPDTTSQPFAKAVKDEFNDDVWANGGRSRPASAYVYSPTTGKSYLMNCHATSKYTGNGYTCKGGNNAEVVFMIAG